jgi:hypothetical protein
VPARSLLAGNCPLSGLVGWWLSRSQSAKLNRMGLAALLLVNHFDRSVMAAAADGAPWWAENWISVLLWIERHSKWLPVCPIRSLERTCLLAINISGACHNRLCRNKWSWRRRPTCRLSKRSTDGSLGRAAEGTRSVPAQNLLGLQSPGLGLSTDAAWLTWISEVVCGLSLSSLILVWHHAFLLNILNVHPFVLTARLRCWQV